MPQPLPSPPPLDPAQGVPGLRSLGTGHQQAAAGDDPRFSGVAATAVTVLNVAALRALVAAPAANSFYRTLGYAYSGTGAGLGVGAGTYRWNSTSTTTDDGALTIKITAVATGRFEFVMPPDKLFPLACSSLDATGTTHVGTALSALVAALYAAGYEGIDGTHGKYNTAVQGYTIPARTENYPWRHRRFEMVGDGVVPGGSGGVGADLTVESGITGTGAVNPVAITGYGSRFWTQTLYTGIKTFTGVSDIRNLSVGDTVLLRLGACPSDASGVAQIFQFAKITSITPTTGNAGNITIDQTVVETPIYPAPAYNLNFIRNGNKHDLFKVTGFQDNISWEDCTLRTASVGAAHSRNHTMRRTRGYDIIQLGIFYGCFDTKFEDTYVDRVQGVNTDAGDPTTDPYANYGWGIVLDSCRRTNFHNTVYDRYCASGGLLDNEADCRDTTFTGLLSTGWLVDTLPAPLLINNGVISTPFSFDVVSIDYWVMPRGGQVNNSLNVRIGTLVLDRVWAYTSAITSGGQPQPGNVSAGHVHNTLIYKGNEYRVKRHCQVICNKIGVNTVTEFPIPITGIIRACRIKASSTTGITDLKVSSSTDPACPGVDLHSLLVANTWISAFDPTTIQQSRGNFAASDTQKIVVTTNGSFSASTYIIVDLEVFCVERKYDGTETYSDTSPPDRYVVSGSPSASADYVGQEVIGDSNTSIYKAVTTGAGAADWVKLGGAPIPSTVSVSAAPSTPSASHAAVYVDSTSKNLACKDDAGNVNHGVRTVTATASQWIRAIADDGSVTKSQPATTDISGIAAIASSGSASDLVAGTISQARLGNAGTSAGRTNVEVTIDRQVLSSESNYTASWSAGAYKRVILRLSGTYDGTLALRVNGDTGGNYSDGGNLTISNITIALTNDKGTNSGAIVGHTNAASTKSKVTIDFDVVKDGLERVGTSRTQSHAPAGTAATYSCLSSGFCWHNTAADITSITVLPSTGTITGTVEVVGIPP